MRFSISAALPCLLLVLGSTACNTSKSTHDDWQVLFDGTNLDAWRNFKSETVAGNWGIEDGTLVCLGGGGGDLITREMYGNFSFEFEWMVTPKANSGIMYHVTEDNGATYMSGPEYQVLDNATLGTDGDMRTSASSNYALHAPVSDNTKPVGEWNSGRIDVNGKHVQHWLNGQLNVDFMQWTPQWESLVKASKFDKMPAYGRSATGHIVIQDHGNKVHYRNLRVRTL